MGEGITAAVLDRRAGGDTRVLAGHGHHLLLCLNGILLYDSW